eukprot:939678-Pelagomonas_calceolata.AAC.1
MAFSALQTFIVSNIPAADSQCPSHAFRMQKGHHVKHEVQAPRIRRQNCLEDTSATCSLLSVGNSLNSFHN